MISNDNFAKTSSYLSNSGKNIRTVLQLFGQEDTYKPYFVSRGAGIQLSPEESFRADFYVYTICTAGSAVIMVNNTEVRIEKNSFLAAIPSTILLLKKHSKDFKAKVLIFEKSFLLKNILDARQMEQLGFFSFDIIAHLRLHTDEAMLLKSKLDEIHNSTKQEKIFQHQIIQSLVFNLLFETAEMYFKHLNLSDKKAMSREEEIYIKFMKLAQQYSQAHKGLDFYSQKLCISDRYLIQVCKDISGKTPGTILAELLLHEAKLLLKNPDYNISMVSNELNYSSVAAFSKFFKRQTGLSPNKYKQE